MQLSSQELVELISQLEEAGQSSPKGTSSITRSDTSTSVSSITSLTDKERHMKVSFGDKAFRMWGRCIAESFPSVGFVCKKGLKPEMPNQDSFLIVRVEGRYSIYGVFDGHGAKGHDVSNYVKEQLAKVLVLQSDLESNPANALTNAFAMTQILIEEATEMRHIDAKKSGCTATVVYHQLLTNVLFVAHVGDSRAVLGVQCCVDGHLQWTAGDLTEDHKPNIPAERIRIEQGGGEVVFDGYQTHRVYARGSRYPGLNMSRAMGDLLGVWDAGISVLPDVSRIGIEQCNVAERVVAGGVPKSPPGAGLVVNPPEPVLPHAMDSNCPDGFRPTESALESDGDGSIVMTAPSIKTVSNAPSLSSFVIRPCDRLLLIGSDGIWDFISSDEAVQIASSFPSNQAMQAAAELATVAWARWLQNTRGTVVDDITSIVVYLLS